MSKLSTAIKLVHQNPNDFFAALLKNFSFFFPDKLYLKLMFRCKMGYWMDFCNPKTFCEKLQWLKLYNRNPLYTTLVDKYAVKKWVADKIGEEYIIPLLGVWNNANEIDFDTLPNLFVLKTTNGGGGDVVICKDKSKFERKKNIAHLNHSLKNRIYNNYREWPYKNVPSRIIAELKMMISVCEKLSDKFPFVRVDLYNVDGKIYFGELTFYPASGYGKFEPGEWNYKLGNLLKLPLEKR